MAAEKLTKARLIQLLVMLVILIIAFTWRTISYSQINTKCYLPEDCHFAMGNRNYLLEQLNQSDNAFTYLVTLDKDVTVSVEDGNAKTERGNDYLKIMALSTPITIKFERDNEHRNILINRRN